MKKIGVILLCCMIVCTGCGKKNIDTKNYTKAYYVSGVQFSMPEKFLSSATAITAISEDVDYSEDTYLYKNGTSTYLLFNMNEVVVIVEKGTEFGFEKAGDIRTALGSTSLDGIWFTPNNEKKFDYEEDRSDKMYKLIARVDGDVSITTDLYGMFTGYLAYVSDGENEYTMFAGVPNGDELTEQQDTVLYTIAYSLEIAEQDKPDEMYVVNSTESNPPVANISEKTAQEEPKSELETETEIVTEIEEIEIIETEEPTEEMTEGTEENIPTEEETQAEEETVESFELTEELVSSEEPKTEPEAVEPEMDEEEEDTTPSNNESETLSSLGSNQQRRTNSSSIYSMAKVGESSILYAISNDSSQLLETTITINSVLKGQDAIDIIQKYCNSPECPYQYSDAPAGYSWQAVKYQLTTRPEDLYVDIKLKGLDGEKLKYRGVPASSRTHDIFAFGKDSGNGMYNLYCYYAVPNGCMEYMLECGSKVQENTTACFYIN